MVDKGESEQGVWPRVSLAAATAQLCAPGALFELEDIEVRSVTMRCWKNIPRSLAELANHVRTQFPDRTFLIYEDDRVTYEAWFRAVAALAEELRARGIGKGDRVALAMRNLPEWPVAFFAAAVIGAIVVPLNAWWTASELSYGLSHSGSSALICDEERWDRIKDHLPELPELATVLVARAEREPGHGARCLEDVLGSVRDYAGLPDRPLPSAEIAPDDDATIFYTSGTTGLPKGALGTHRNILLCTLSSGFASHRAMLRRGETPQTQPKIVLLVIPLFHVTASHSFMMSTMAAGGTFVLMRKWDATKALGLIERERVQVTGGVPTIAWQILEHPERDRYDLSSLEILSYGGAPSAPELVRRIKDDLGLAASNGWGMTETSATVTIHGAEDYLDHADSCGPALPISRLRIMDEDGMRELPRGEVGELWAFGPQIVKGYWNDPAATAAMFHDGWVRTGDIARIDEQGFCVIVDRAKDIVIRGGENIYCSEVENVLYDFPGVMDAALIGMPHPTLGEVPVAVVHMASSGCHEGELRDWVAARLAGFKVPTQVLFHDTLLPRNANGKILKKELRALLAPA
jgi:acyl-CoA synthetase (AMP-forming)/AMP-acid ligase II